MTSSVPKALTVPPIESQLRFTWINEAGEARGLATRGPDAYEVAVLDASPRGQCPTSEGSTNRHSTRVQTTADGQDFAATALTETRESVEVTTRRRIDRGGRRGRRSGDRSRRQRLRGGACRAGGRRALVLQPRHGVRTGRGQAENRTYESSNEYRVNRRISVSVDSK